MGRKVVGKRSAGNADTADTADTAGNAGNEGDLEGEETAMGRDGDVGVVGAQVTVYDLRICPRTNNILLA
jgi:hypothetical protein